MRKLTLTLFFCTIICTAFSQTETSNWTWMNGDTLVPIPTVFGTIGVPDPSNDLGVQLGAPHWTDATGNLWAWGVGGRALWRYNISSDQWTWMAGDHSGGTAGNYGILGVASSTNTPGIRNSSATWVDASGNFWLFGGIGYDVNNTYGSLNDLWKYDISTNLWTWINGDNTVTHSGVYGTRGLASSTNKPGSRAYCTSMKDAAGNFWLFGGTGHDTNGNRSFLNDLWKYNPGTNQWTWISGDMVINASASYGIKGTPSSSNNIGAKNNASGWIDASANIWLFGGDGMSQVNDMWKYNPATNQWTWMNGDNTSFTAANYGTKGVATSTNTPGHRFFQLT